MGKIVLLFLLSVFVVSATNAYPPHSNSGVSFGVFYNSLDAHGEWINVDADIYAWRPAGIYEGWRPYTVGRWAWTSDGWYWVSDEPWGWATYHYGRWFYDDFYGWLWIPGNEWAPAWVEWRYGGDCVGWAPLGPYAVFSVNVGIRYHTHWVTPGFWWSFVDCRYVGSSEIHRYVYRTDQNTRYIGRTRSAGNVRYTGGRIVSRGPERDYVERHGKTRLERVDIVDADNRQERVVRQGSRDRIEAYRPKIKDRESTIERPIKIRETGRRIKLDVDNTAARLHEREREASGLGSRRDMDRNAVDNNQRKRDGYGQEIDRSGNPPSREQRDARPERQQTGQNRRDAGVADYRAQRESQRSPNPERTIRRSDQRQPDHSTEKGSGRRR